MMQKDIKYSFDCAKELDNLKRTYNKLKAEGLFLNLSRGKPGKDQLSLSNELLNTLSSPQDCIDESGFDCRNYGLGDGVSEMKEFFSEILGVDKDNIFIGGNSSLNMMYDTISQFMTHGTNGEKPWFGQGVKFLCPVPGYDRHFAITEYFNIEMINVPLYEDGPDMDMIEKLVEGDELIKGIWCVPKYSNPSGVTYSDETVRRFARLKPKAKDFRIIWDNAYCLHDLSDEKVELLNIITECQKSGNEDLPIVFCSTSKITFPGAGIAAMASSKRNIEEVKNRYFYQTIGYDKLNQLRHIKFLKNLDNVKAHMQKHRSIIKPKFNVILNAFENEFRGYDIKWTNPKGGYFITLILPDGCAKRTVSLCKEAGLVLTSAGATHPYGKDPQDSVLRIAPTFLSLEEVKKASEILCLCAKIAVLEKDI